MKKKIMTLALTAAMAASMGMTALQDSGFRTRPAGGGRKTTVPTRYPSGNGLTEIRTGSTSAMLSIPTDISIRIQQLRTATPSMRMVPGRSATLYS